MNINCIPSYTNFLFFPLGKYPGDFAQDMFKKNVIVRSNNYPDGKWARVSVGTMDEMKKFIELMKGRLERVKFFCHRIHRSGKNSDADCPVVGRQAQQFAITNCWFQATKGFD
jgi:hypothetical protein